MKLIEAYTKLKALNQAMISTQDVAALFNIELNYASILLTRLTKDDALIKIGRGKWLFAERAEQFALPEYLTAPFPSYISLQSALYQHGMISQIPDTIYAVSLARTKKIKTTIATISIHHIDPILFIGFKSLAQHPFKLATPEKALFDYFYFSRGRSKLFYALPEIELPNNFNLTLIYNYIRKVKSKSIAHFVQKKFLALGINI